MLALNWFVFFFHQVKKSYEKKSLQDQEDEGKIESDERVNDEYLDVSFFSLPFLYILLLFFQLNSSLSKNSHVFVIYNHKIHIKIALK